MFKSVRRCAVPVPVLRACLLPIVLLAISSNSVRGQSCDEVPSGILCDEVLFSSYDQNMWGPGNEKPKDATIKLFRQTWNGEKSASRFIDFRTFGSFGGELRAGSSGALGAYIGIGNMDGGTVDVDYSARMIMLPPPADLFRPGEWVQISFFGMPDEDSVMSTSGRFSSGKFSLWGELDLNLTAGGRACAGTCVDLNLPPISGKTFGDAFPKPPGTPPISGNRMQLVFELPGPGQQIAAGPLWDALVAEYGGDCENDQLEIEEFGDIYDKAGISGCLGLPKFPEEGGLQPGTPFLKIDDKVPFIDLDLDLDFWAAKTKKFPELAYTREFLNGLAEAYIDSMDFDLNGTLSVDQELTFAPKPRVTLRFPLPVAYLIFDSATNALVRPGQGDTIDLSWGERLMFRAPDQEFSIETEYSLPNTFTNNSDLVLDFGFVERYLEAGFSLESQLLGYEGFKICEPWPDYSCWRPGIWSPSVDFPVGPLWEFRQDLKTFRDSTLLDNNRPPWSLAGFQTVAGSSIFINPAFLPDLVISGAPQGPVPEGTPIHLSTVGSGDRDGDPFTSEVHIYSSNQFLFSVQKDADDLLCGECDFTFSLRDQGWYIANVLGYDLDPVPSDPIAPRREVRLVIDVVNVPPSLAGVADGAGVEGVAYELPVTVSDPGVDDAHIVSVNWGDGTNSDLVNLAPGGGTVPFSHVYADDGAYTATVCAEDERDSTCESATLTIGNAAPAVVDVVSEQALAPVAGGVGVELQFQAAFNDPGTLDTHSGRLIWDEDASEVLLAVRESSFGPPGASTGMNGEVSAAPVRVFGSPGTKTTQVCVLDDDGDESCIAGPEIHVAGADLAIGGSATPASAPIGDTLRLNYTATNNGPDAAPNAFVTVDLPVDGGGNQVTTLVSAKQGGAGGLEQKLVPFDLAAQGELGFGAAMAVAGDTLVVSADGLDAVEPDQGGVYVFERVGDTWVAGPKIFASDGQTNDLFGEALAISADGSTIVVGAPGASEDGVNSREGALYVYRRLNTGDPNSRIDDTWREEATRLVPASLAEKAQLGNSVSIEGDTIVVGAFGDDFDTGDEVLNAVGAAFVFERNDNDTPDPTDDYWEATERLAPAIPTTEEKFGQQVALSSGHIAVASGDGDANAGRITLFEEMGGAWVLLQELDGAELGDDGFYFGQGGLALQGNRLLVSTQLYRPPGYLHDFQFDGDAFVLDSEVRLRLRSGIALDGDYAAVASYEYLPGADGFEEETGVVRTLQWNGSAWVPEGTLFPTAVADRSDQFGLGLNRVALDGRSVLAGAPNSPQLGKLGMGVVYVMQTCEERPAGHVRCGLGTLPAGASRDVQIDIRIGCALAPGVVLVTDAAVGGSVIDPDASNNTTSLGRSTADVPGLCGYDATPPVITPVVTGVEGDNGWYVSDVDLDWQVADPDSGIDSTVGCGPSQVLADTTGEEFTCEATNGSGWTSSETVLTRRDGTPPSIVLNMVGTLGNNGWYQSGVTVEFLCDDDVSGILDCTGSVDIPDEGIHPGITGAVTDTAGNRDTVSVDVRIDMTPPVIVATRTLPNEAGWNAGDVTVEFDCSDALSGIEACPAPIVLTGEGAGQSAEGSAEDRAGLIASALVSDIRIDRTAPTVTQTVEPAPNASGWHRVPVTVSFECSDALSGMNEEGYGCPDPVVFEPEGAGQEANVVAGDLAGNEGAVSVGPVNIDYTPPVISASIVPEPDPLSGLRTLPVTVSFSCSDALSGVAACPPPAVITTAGLNQSVEGEASDLAGNLATLVVEDIDAGIPALTLLTGDRVLDEGEFFGGDLASVSAAALTGGVAWFDWGDGFLVEVPITEDGLANTAYAYADDGAYTVTVTVVPQFGEPLVETFEVDVSNVSPEFLGAGFGGSGAAAVPPPEASVIVGYDLLLHFDYGDAGSADSHSATVDWGDGSPVEDVVPVEAPLGPPSSGGMTGAILATHAYLATGSYAGEVCVSDDEGAETCLGFTVTVEPEPEIPALECTAMIGTPLIGETLDVPLEALVQGSGIEQIEIRWEDSDNILPFDDRQSLTPILAFGASGTDDINIAVSYNALVHFTNGASTTCSAYACGIVGPGGDLSGCELWLPVTEIDLPTLKPGIDAHVSIAGGGERCGFTDAQFVDPLNIEPPPPAREKFPIGALQFTLENCEVGSTVAVEIAFSRPTRFGAWFKLMGDHWERYPFTVIDASTISFEVTDGGAGDSDGEANGIIVDPGGPVVRNHPTTRHSVR